MKNSGSRSGSAGEIGGGVQAAFRGRAEISSHSGASAGWADARRRDAGDVGHRRGAATPQMPVRRRAPQGGRFSFELGIRSAVLGRAAIPADLEAARHGLGTTRAGPRKLADGMRFWRVVVFQVFGRRRTGYYRLGRFFHDFFHDFFKDRAARPADFHVIAVLRRAFWAFFQDSSPLRSSFEIDFCFRLRYIYGTQK
jgi:hypothetical protein